MNTILAFLSGPSGKTSSMRVATILCVTIVMGVWAYVSVRKVELQPLTGEHIAIVLGAMGIKAYQRKTEQDDKAATLVVTKVPAQS